MFQSLIETIVPQLKAVRWLRVVVGAFGGLLLVFLIYLIAHFIWVGRPQEFYVRGYEKGIADEVKRQNEIERISREKIAEKVKSENERRQKILSAPSRSPDDLLKLMYGNDL